MAACLSLLFDRLLGLRPPRPPLEVVHLNTLVSRVTSEEDVVARLRRCRRGKEKLRELDSVEGSEVRVGHFVHLTSWCCRSGQVRTARWKSNGTAGKKHDGCDTDLHIPRELHKKTAVHAQSCEKDQEVRLS